MMMVIDPNSRAHKGEKERGEVKGEYRGMMMIIAPNSHAHKRKKERGEVKGEYGRVCGEEEGNADYGGMVQPSQQHVASCVNGVEWGFCTRGLENVGSLLGQHPGRIYTRGRRSPTLIYALPSGHRFSRLIRHAGKRWAYFTPHSQGEGGI